ncbi:SsgA family sporulation/cell division regulator [Sphaerimonospora sp. CA-214678]|uniref:SsgA family sporulation/cell division regulator n=1 Tax=Sphaerimonospora sp. CA-214678 TaxID=3240029 RepID=UPI003D908F44
MSPLTISDSIPLFMDGSPLTGFLHYRRHDPYVVRLDVPGFMDRINVLRDSLCTGQNRPVDDEYIQIQPYIEDLDWIRITLRNVGPEPLVLWAERKSLGSSLARTYEMVPRGFELLWDGFPCLE